MAPTAYVAQPLWSHGSYSQDAWRCPELNLYSPADGTPIICTANDPNLFYRNRGLDPENPGKDLADRIRTVRVFVSCIVLRVVVLLAVAVWA